MFFTVDKKANPKDLKTIRLALYKPNKKVPVAKINIFISSFKYNKTEAVITLTPTNFFCFVPYLFIFVTPGPVHEEDQMCLWRGS